MYTHTHIYIYRYASTYTYTYHMHMHIHLHIHIHIHVRIHLHIQTHIHTYIHTYIHIYIYMYVYLRGSSPKLCQAYPELRNDCIQLHTAKYMFRANADLIAFGVVYRCLVGKHVFHFHCHGNLGTFCLQRVGLRPPTIMRPPPPTPRFSKPCKLASKYVSVFVSYHASILFANAS